LLNVHGGPGSFTEFDYAYHPHWSELVARGWFVLALNPVGSSGYTREFFERLRGR
jgi:dipeptidyl aminopeptidase/acylaminoacyl peptidase